MEHKKIVVVGSSNTDMVVQSSTLPVPGETVLGGQFLMNPGGKGANQAVAAARLGGEITFIAKVGNDMFGQAAKQGFDKEGIDTKFVFVDEERPSGVALIMVDEKGENCISVASGANANLLTPDIDEGMEAIQAASYVLMQLETPLETIAYVAKKAFENGAKVVLNPAPAQDLPDTLMPKLFAITPNETETALLTKIDVNDEETAGKAARILHGKGVELVIITMGAKGAFVSYSDFQGMIPAPKVQAVDTTAAGDTFNGALIVGLAEGMRIKEAVIFANQAAALSVTRLGAQASTPYRKEI